jgi:predicted transcriptional regulator
MKVKVTDESKMLQVGQAFSSPTRLKILRFLKERELTVTGVAAAIGMTEANARAQIKILLEAGLIECRYEPGIHGLRKLCRASVEQVIIDVNV